jgi:hypothetical protein
MNVSGVAAILVGLAALAACEPRVEEPVRPGLAAPPPAPATASGAAGKAPSAQAEARCVRATPATPARTLARDGGVDPACPKDPEKAPKLRTGKVAFDGAKGAALTVEIASDDHDRQRGLMYRRHMAEDAGMIFLFDERQNHTFWMHNTCIPLDMMFIDGDGTIVGIEENVPTMDDSTFEVGCPSRYVLEVNAGWSRRHGVAAGQSVKLDL